MIAGDSMGNSTIKNVKEKGVNNHLICLNINFI